MILSSGIEFINADPAVVTEYLQKRRVDQIVVSPSSMKIIPEEGTLFLIILNGKLNRYRIRRTFLYKLLKWFHFPSQQLNKLSAESIASVLNDYLIRIKRMEVTVKIESGEALTILSPDYNEISDLSVIDSLKHQGIRSISRNDFFISINTIDLNKTEPAAGDVCGIGVNLVNSETGFRALSVSHFIYRYICSNGAYVKSKAEGDSRIHYGKEDLSEFLRSKTSELDLQRHTILNKLNQSFTNSLLQKKDHYLNKIQGVTGRKEAEEILSEFESISTQYELLNIITAKAKQYDLSRRYFLENIAGELVLY